MKAWRRSGATAHPTASLTIVSSCVLSIPSGGTMRIAVGHTVTHPSAVWEVQVKTAALGWTAPVIVDSLPVSLAQVDYTDEWLDDDIQARVRYRLGASYSGWRMSNMILGVDH